MQFVLTVLFIIVLIIGAIALGHGALQLVLDKRAKSAVRYRRATGIAERSLRSIANGTAGNPEMEAQAALDEIATLTEKELN